MRAKQFEFLNENPIRVIGGFFESTTNSQRRNFHNEGNEEHEAADTRAGHKLKACATTAYID